MTWIASIVLQTQSQLSSQRDEQIKLLGESDYDVRDAVLGDTHSDDDDANNNVWRDGGEETMPGEFSCSFRPRDYCDTVWMWNERIFYGSRLISDMRP